MALGLEEIAPYLKNFYDSEQTVKRLLYKTSPMLSRMITKEQKTVTGENYSVPVQWANQQGVSTNLLEAKTRASDASAKSKKSTFKVETVDLYAVDTITNKEILATKNDKGAFISAIYDTIFTLHDQFVRVMATALYGGGYGSLGIIKTIIDPTHIVVSDVINFDPGMNLVFAQFESVGGLRAGEYITSSVDAETKTVELTTPLDAGIVALDSIFRKGDRQEIPVRQHASGFRGWIPDVNRATEISLDYWGVIRNQYPSRLAGSFKQFTAGTDNLEESILQLKSIVGQQGGKPETIVCNPYVYLEIMKAIGSKDVYYQEFDKNSPKSSTSTSIGRDGVTFHNSEMGGYSTIVQDPYCPTTRIYLLDESTWRMLSLGKNISESADQKDGNTYMNNLHNMTAINEDPDQAGVQIRLEHYYNYICKAPAHNGVLYSPDSFILP